MTDKKNEHHTILILADGDTWETIDGQSICTINDEEFRDLCDGRITPGDLHPIAEIAFKNQTISF
jgi:hypothetical protein